MIFFDVTKIDGKDVLDLKAYFYGFEVKDGVVYEFTGLYNGDKKKSKFKDIEIVHRKRKSPR